MSKLTIQQKKNNSKTNLNYYCNNHLSMNQVQLERYSVYTHIFIISVYSLL